MTERSKRFVKLKFDGFHCVGEGETKTLAQVLGFRNMAVFQCIALHQNEKYQSDLTLDQIADLIGMGRTTVQKSINEIVEIRYEGEPIMLRKTVGKGRYQRNLYEIQPNLLVSVFNETHNDMGSNSERNAKRLSSKSELKEAPLSSESELSKETVDN